MTEYQKQLKDPRWQKKRLEIMERDKWTCQDCGDSEATLTVHHKSYRMDDGNFAEIWDYEDQHLITLCDNCHTREEAELEHLKKYLFFSLRGLCENSDAIKSVIGLFDTLSKYTGGRVSVENITVLSDYILSDSFQATVSEKFFSQLNGLFQED